MTSFVFERRIDASVAVVWEILTNHAAYAAWGGAKESVLEARGTPDENGVGAIRRLSDGPLAIRERVLEFEPQTRFTYTILSGPPLRDYLGTVVLSPDSGGTRVRWTVEFRGKIPFTGPLFKPVVMRVIGGLLKKATAEAERRAARA
jgi:uncharacterized protein YndB with AHSA1/START domain